MNKNNLNLCKFAIIGMMAVPLFSACSDDNTVTEQNNDNLKPGDSNFGKAVGNFEASEWYPGGELGTTELESYATATPAVENQGLDDNFNKGNVFFERYYSENTPPFKGLGPAWVRKSCEDCHPSYGHGKRQDSYNANTRGNGYLLVIYDKDTNQYITEVTGMPQTAAMYPFKAPIDESGIHITWNKISTFEDGTPMKFSDGETITLQYPDVTIDQAAFNTDPKPTNYDVRLESTIGIYGNGLLDAIDQDDMKAQYQLEASHGAKLNPGMWNTAANDWAGDPTLGKANGAWYRLADGTMKVKKFTYAMTRASLQDGPGANAIWNITNVTRSDRHYFYSTKAWAKAMAEDNDVISYIKANGQSSTSLLHPYWAETEDGIKANVEKLLGLNAPADSATFRVPFVDNAPYNGEEEMSNQDYYDFMVWHRGVAVPAARNLDDAQVQKGKELFTEWGCVRCHRPSWKTGADNYWVDNAIKAYAATNGLDASKILPKYANQTIYPYTDMVQHRLFMKNDIRTGWCRTTPLWGRGLSKLLTGAEDRLHDCRAGSEEEAIMWHCWSKDSDAYGPAMNFYKASKEDRDAVVAFLRAI